MSIEALSLLEPGNFNSNGNSSGSETFKDENNNRDEMVVQRIQSPLSKNLLSDLLNQQLKLSKAIEKLVKRQNKQDLEVLDVKTDSRRMNSHIIRFDKIPKLLMLPDIQNKRHKNPFGFSNEQKNIEPSFPKLIKLPIISKGFSQSMKSPQLIKIPQQPLKRPFSIPQLISLSNISFPPQAVKLSSGQISAKSYSSPTKNSATIPNNYIVSKQTNDNAIQPHEECLDTQKEPVDLNNFDYILDDFLMHDIPGSFSDFVKYYKNMFEGQKFPSYSKKSQTNSGLKQNLPNSDQIQTNETSMIPNFNIEIQEFEKRLSEICEKVLRDRLKLDDLVHSRGIEASQAIYSALENFEKKISDLDKKVHEIPIKPVFDSSNEKPLQNNPISIQVSVKTEKQNEKSPSNNKESISTNPSDSLKITPTVKNATQPIVSDVVKSLSDRGDDIENNTSDLESFDLSMEITDISEPSEVNDVKKDSLNEILKNVINVTTKRKVAKLNVENSNNNNNLKNPFTKESKVRSPSQPDQRFLSRIQTIAKNRAKRLQEAQNLANKAVSEGMELFNHLKRPFTSGPRIIHTPKKLLVPQRRSLSAQKPIYEKTQSPAPSEIVRRSKSSDRVVLDVDEILSNVLGEKSRVQNSPTIVDKLDNLATMSEWSIPFEVRKILNSNKAPYQIANGDPQISEDLSFSGSHLTNSFIDWDQIDRLLID